MVRGPLHGPLLWARRLDLMPILGRLILFCLWFSTTAGVHEKLSVGPMFARWMYSLEFGSFNFFKADTRISPFGGPAPRV